MKTKRLSIQLVVAGIGLAGVLLIGLWALSSPRSTTADAFVLYSPIPPEGNPQFGLAKTVDNDNPQPGDEIVYTLTYSNTIPGSKAFNVRLYEFLPAGIQYLSANPVPDAAADGMLVYNRPSLGPTTDSFSVTVTGRVLTGISQLYNHALILADGVVPTHASLLTGVTVPLPTLRLVKTGYAVVLPENELVYTLLAQNTGAAMAYDVTLLDVLPGGTPLVDASPPPDEVTLPLLRWSLGELMPGERRTIVITTTSPSSLGIISNTAVLDSLQHVVTQTIFSTQVVTPAAILRLTKHGSASVVTPGEQLVYTLNYENAGNQPVDTVRLTDTLPSDVELNAADPSPDQVVGQQAVWELNTLGVDESGQIVITTTVTGAGGITLRNVADITGHTGSFPDHAEFETDVRRLLIYLPFMIR
jgi:uncharacterized repeat protein (TIGR01451 family)